jgi:hypothetical protein
MVFGELLVPAPVRSDSPRDWVDGVVQEIAVLRGWRSDAQGGRTVTVSFHDDASTADTTVGEGEEGRVPLAGAAAGAAHMLRSLVDEAAACALEASASVCTRVRAQGREDLSKESLQEDTEAIVATYVEFLRLRERENMAALLGTAAQPPPTTSGGMASGRGAATGSSSEEQLRTAVYQAQQTVHKLRQQGRYKEASELESELVEEEEEGEDGRLRRNSTHAAGVQSPSYRSLFAHGTDEEVEEGEYDSDAELCDVE